VSDDSSVRDGYHQTLRERERREGKARAQEKKSSNKSSQVSGLAFIRRSDMTRRIGGQDIRVACVTYEWTYEFPICLTNYSSVHEEAHQNSVSSFTDVLHWGNL
jgi:hypothetical protein